MADSRPIGVMDSGVGGLSVLREIWRQLPHEDILYFADQRHVPYGPRPLSEVRKFTEEIARWLLAQQAKCMVIACNAASAAALKAMRALFPDVPFVGMEPAIKPAAEHSQTGTVGVIATAATFQGELFASLVDRYGSDVHVLTQPCPGLVPAVERGSLDGPEVDAMLHNYLDPLLAAGIDHLALGCTHYPFLIPAIRRVVGPNVEIIDPAPAVARQVGRVLKDRGLENRPDHQGQTKFYTSGDADELSRALRQLLGRPDPVMAVQPALS